MKDLSIQIVNYKTKSYLINLLADIMTDLEYSELKYEINVLDNNSGDDLSMLENKYAHKTIFFHYSEKIWDSGRGIIFWLKNRMPGTF